VCMGHASGVEDQVTWRRLELRATDSEDMFTFEDVEELIVAVVDVQRRVERVDSSRLIPSGHGAAGGLGPASTALWIRAISNVE
jgi:hypothetical protein